MRGALGTLIVALAVGGCWWGGDDLPEATMLEIVDDTDGQRAFAGARLPLPLAVIATADDAQPVTRAEVRWTMVGGSGGTLSDTVTVADANGRAEVALTLPTDPGVVEVEARLANKRDVAVALVAEALAAPVVTSLSPSTFTTGDAVSLVGTGLSDSLPVEIDGVRARILGSSGVGLGVVVEVPPCLTPGSVRVQVRFPGGASAPVTGTYTPSAGTVAMAVGDYRSFDAAAMDGCVTFPAAGPAGAEYLLVPQAATGVAGASAPYLLSSGAAPAVPVGGAAADAEPLPLPVRFHDFLRRQEAEFARLPGSGRVAEAAPGEVAGLEVGDRRSFRVCNAVTCQQLEDFTEVTAAAKYVGDHAAIFQDLAAPDTLRATDIADLGQLFDRDLYGVASAAFGSESDVDRNGHVIILMTPVVNGLTDETQCTDAVITGFFYAVDIDPRFRNDERSNKGEVFYALTPDPTGKVGCVLTLDAVRRFVQVTFVHELQHMISYHQHVLVRDGETEEVWLNEAMSHLSEELAALHFQNLGDATLFSRFAIGNLYNAYQYLRAPGDHLVAFEEGTGTLAERGGSWLFLRWLVDQFGMPVVRRLEETREIGPANITAATAEPFGPLVRDWFFANYVSDLPDFDAPARLSFRTWSLRRTFGNLHGQAPDRFTMPFPIVPAAVAAGAFSVSGQLNAASGEYVLALQGPGAPAFAVHLTDPAGGAVDPAVEPRLNVIRIR